MNVEGIANKLRFRRDPLSAYKPIDLGGGHLLPAEDVLEGHFNRMAVGRPKENVSTRQVTVKIAPDLNAAITVLAPSLTPLTDLAEDLVDVLPQVTPAAQFRQELQKALEMTYRQHAAQRRLGTRPAPVTDGGRTLYRVVMLAVVMLTVMFAMFRMLKLGRAPR